MSLAFLEGWTEEYYPAGGAGIASSAGAANPVSLGGIGYEIDTSERYRDSFKHSSIPQQRASFEDRENVDRGTLNPEAFWRRTFESWHVGAGQTHFDRRDESNPWRFRRSKNTNVWDKYQLSLLNATDAKAIFAAGTGALAIAGTYAYATDGTTLKRTADITPGTPTFTTITGTPGTTATSIASDGFNILTAHGTNGIYKTTRGAATTASNITGTVSTVFYGKGRWIASSTNVLYDVTTLVAGGGALPAALFTHSNTDFVWNCFAEGPTALYAGGFSGDKSLIYRLTIKEDGTGLNQPVVAGFLPDGELIYSLQGYLGFILIGTSKGVRVGVVGGNGDLTIGAFLPTDDAVRCFEGQGTFVWYGWSDFEATDAGLGRLNMETFSDPDALAPAYASDIMAGITGDTTSVATFQNRRVFTVDTGAAAIIYAEEIGTLAATGQIDSGVFDYGLTDEKVSLFVDMSHISTAGSHSVYLSVDRETFALLATMTEEHFPIPTGEARAHEFEIRLVLNRDSGDTSTGPIIRLWALRSQPVSPLTEEILVPLRIGPVNTRSDTVVEFTASVAQIENIETLCETKEVTPYTEGDRAWSVIVADFEFDQTGIWIGANTTFGVKGTAVVRLKTVI